LRAFLAGCLSCSFDAGLTSDQTVVGGGSKHRAPRANARDSFGQAGVEGAGDPPLPLATLRLYELGATIEHELLSAQAAEVAGVAAEFLGRLVEGDPVLRRGAQAAKRSLFEISIRRVRGAFGRFWPQCDGRSDDGSGSGARIGTSAGKISSG
jgi:hypothetical protein